jgi:nitrogenase molybdenum-cofactor synthesis protein NifE
MPELMEIKKDLEGKTAAVYTGGAFKVFSLVRSLRTIGMKVVVAGSQTGTTEDYKQLHELCDEGAVLLDDTNPVELAKFVLEKDADLFIGGVKERPIAFKLGVAFCDHNHERKIALAGFDGLVNFAREVHASVMSPVWKFVPRRMNREPEKKTAPRSMPIGCTPAMCMTCDSICGDGGES